MEFPSIWYFSCWTLVSLVFSTAGIHALRKATISVSDVVKLGFELLIVSSVSFSTFHAFLNRPALEDDRDLNATYRYKILVRFYDRFFFLTSLILCSVGFYPVYFKILGYEMAIIFVLLIAALSFPFALEVTRVDSIFYQPIGKILSAFAGLLIMYPYHTLCCVLSQWLLLLSLNSRILDLDSNLYETYAMYQIYGSLGACIMIEFYVIKVITASNIHKHQKIIEIVFGMLGTILAQYYFSVKSLALMLCFLSLAVAWLGILANVQPRTDFGILQFLVTASSECAVSLFGLHFYTFLVGCGGIVLMVLRWKLESVSLRHPGRKETVLRGWKRLEELYDIDFNDSSIQQPSEAAQRLTRLICRIYGARFGVLNLFLPH